MAAKKKKKKKEPARIDSTDQDFQPDPLVEGDNLNFDQERIFTSNQNTIKYTFREHFLFFPWENKKSKFYSINCPPAAFHLEKRDDLKKFDFFAFRKNKSSVNLYRFALEKRLCDDLLEYVSDNIEEKARSIFKQQLEELRNSRKVIELPVQDQNVPITPLFPPRVATVWRRNIVRRKPDTSNEFMEWLNNLKIDPLVQELPEKERDIFFIVQKDSIKTDDNQFFENLKSSHYMLDFSTIEESQFVRKFIRHLIFDGFQRKATKFKFAICSPPGSGKTYIKNMFSGYSILDLDDITFFDPVNSRIFHKLINSRDWLGMRREYHRVIRSKFKEGIILCQNASQVPEEIPFIQLVSNSFLGKAKEWSYRGNFDLFKTGKNLIYIKDRIIRNLIHQIVFDEIYNSFNYFDN